MRYSSEGIIIVVMKVVKNLKSAVVIEYLYAWKSKHPDVIGTVKDQFQVASESYSL